MCTLKGYAHTGTLVKWEAVGAWEALRAGRRWGPRRQLVTGRQLESGRQWGTRRYQGPSKVEEATVVAVGGRAAI